MWEINIALQEGADRDSAANFLKNMIENDPRYSLLDISEMNRRNRTYAITVSIFIYGFIGVIIFIGCLNIVNTINANLILRKREIAMLKAIGMTNNDIKKMICFEGVLYGVAASVYGGLLGIAISFILFKILNNRISFIWDFPWVYLLTASLGSILFTLILSYIPLNRINSGNIVDNIKNVCQ